MKCRVPCCTSVHYLFNALKAQGMLHLIAISRICDSIS
ncbi:hypothetical protein E2C01_094334 [Portunus trituberculatus]|uniref:Uncharacterized protein n=1 Tax=Portunus trituberculatus TaxID=210409 RepID=A0A5B7JWK9_PORTR|nr:hypothetical protein [Portunus trituberculatus]